MTDPVARSTPVDLRTLLQHSEWIPASATLQEVQKRFAQHSHDFMAVLDGERVVGLCSREQVGMLMGTQYGFSLYARQPILQQLVANPMIIPESEPIENVLKQVFFRKEENFYGDVVLVDDAGKFIGLILAVSLVRVQTQLLSDTIAQLEWHERHLRTQNDLMLDELRLAHEVQLALLKQNLQSAAEGWGEKRTLQLAHRYRPAGVVSGDFFHVQKIGTDAAVLICDVMGHGVRAALITAMIRAIVEQLQPVAAEPHRLLGSLNSELTRMLAGLEDALFATASYVVADVDRGCWCWATAGHPAPLLLQRPAASVHVLGQREEAGPALGLLPDAEFTSAEFPLRAGDCLLLYTDGIIEARNSAGEEFGTERLKVALSALAGMPGEEMLDALVRSMQDFTGATQTKDDVCLLVLDVVGVANRVEEAELPAARAEMDIASDLKQLRRVREFIRTFCGSLPGLALAEERQAELELAVDEAASNIMRHAYHGRTDQTIHLEAEAFSDHLSLCLYHQGDTFDSSAVRPPALDGSRESGFGIYIIAQSVDDVLYSRDETGRNCVALKKKRTQQGRK